MRKAFKVAVLLAMMVFITGAAGTAAAFQFQLGGDSSVDVSGTADVLEMWAVLNPDLGSLSFDLEEGQSSGQFLFATFGTDEEWVNDDDVIPGTVMAILDFISPALQQGIEGVSVGTVGPAEFFQGWTLTWNDPVTVFFGNGGVFEITLTDTSFESGWWQGPDGCDCPCPTPGQVFAEITLIAAPVPVPAAVWLLGSGLIGLIGLRRKMAA